MKSLVFLFTIAIFTFSNNFGQQMNVASFRLLEADLDARQNFPERDQNGNLCAIIKIVTTQTGFAFDNGTLGITKTKQQLGEIWVYVPYGTKRLTIQHAQLGIIRDYIIPERIEQGRAYELILTTGRVVTQVLDEGPRQQWLAITSVPEGATVFINDELVGITPFNKKMDFGFYSYRLELASYQNYAGKVEITNKQKVSLDINLKSTLGYAYITTSPESEAKLSIDSKPLTNTSPAYSMALTAGNHNILAIKPLFKPVTQTITILEGDTVNVDIKMPENYATVQVSSPATTDILIDGTKKGSGSWQGRLELGLHVFEAKKEKYVSDKQSLNLESGQYYPINLNPIARTGSLDIITTPMKARIRINGSLTNPDGIAYGETPNTITNLLIGEYTISLEKEGFGSLVKTINIAEGQTLELQETLPKGNTITLITQPAGAGISVDGTSRGVSPLSVTLDYGNHTIEAVKDGYNTYSGNFFIEQGKNEYMFTLSSGGEKINIISSPAGATVTIDGKYAGTTPLNEYLLGFGSHTLNLSLNGYNDLDRTIVLQTGKYNDTYYNYPLYKSSGSKEDDYKAPKGESRYKSMKESAKDYYREKAGTAIMFGSHQTVFLNDAFSNLIDNGKLEIATGQALGIKFFSGYPFYFDLTWFSSRYKITDNTLMAEIISSANNMNTYGTLDYESVQDTLTFMHHGIEASAGFSILNLTKYFTVYGGIGYQFSRLAFGRTLWNYLDEKATNNSDAKWDDYIYFSKATNCVIGKIGASLNFGHLQFFAEFKRSFFNDDIKNKQTYLGVAIAF
jgi:hypothetical protein